jgi:hypothetical protein
VRVTRQLRESPSYVAAAEAADAEIATEGLTTVPPSTLTRSTSPAD